MLNVVRETIICKICWTSHARNLYIRKLLAIECIFFSLICNIFLKNVPVKKSFVFLVASYYFA